jgi:hypothetical protein
MLRPLVLALASGLLVAACALVDPPAPAGTVMLQLKVNNQFGLPVDVAVTTATGAYAGEARPPTVPAMTASDVQFFVPIGRPWTITVNDQDLILDSDVRGRTGIIRDIGIDVDQTGATSWWCRGRCP